MRQTTLAERKSVINYYNNGRSYNEISEIINRSRSTVQSIIKRYKKEDRIVNKVRHRSDKKLNATNERWITSKIKEDPTIRAPKLASDVKKYLNITVSESTIRRILKQNNYHGRVVREKTLSTLTNKKKRHVFARKYLKEDFHFWKTVIFTNESKFHIFGSNGRKIVWREQSTKMNIEHSQSTVKCGGESQMVWSCMSALEI